MKELLIALVSGGYIVHQCTPSGETWVEPQDPHDHRCVSRIAEEHGFEIDFPQNIWDNRILIIGEGV
jgi:hypothetical protein